MSAWLAASSSSRVGTTRVLMRCERGIGVWQNLPGEGGKEGGGRVEGGVSGRREVGGRRAAGGGRKEGGVSRKEGGGRRDEGPQSLLKGQPQLRTYPGCVILFLRSSR